MKEERNYVQFKIGKVRIKIGKGHAGLFNESGLIYTTHTVGRFKTIKAINNLFRNLWRVKKWI